MSQFYSINSLRSIALFHIISHHVLSFYFLNAATGIFYMPFIFQITGSGVPLFIFVSGFSLSTNYWDEFSKKTFYKKRFKKILFPYAFFCFIYVVVRPLIESKPVNFEFEDFLNIIFDPWKIYYHFWFIALISSFYLFYPILVKILVKFKDHLLLIFLISVIIQIIWMKSRQPILLSINNLREITLLYKILSWFVNYLFLRYISYFILGVYISKNFSKICSNRKYFYILIISVILLPLLNSILYSETLEVLLYISIILFYYVLVGDTNNHLFDLTAKYSFGIYLIHALVLKYVDISLNIGYNYWYFYLYTFILTFSISFIIIYSLSKVPKSQYLIGNGVNNDYK